MTIQRLIAKHPFALFVVIPTILALLYFVSLAKPTYETETKLIVRENKSSASSMVPGFAAALLGMSGSTSLEDAMILEEFLQSAGFIDLADAQFDLRAHFADAELDPTRRLPADARAETLYKYYRKKVTIRARPETGVLTIQVRAFSPELALNLANFIISESEAMINEISDRMVQTQTQLARRELKSNEARLQSSREALLDFRVNNAILDPENESGAKFGNIAALDSQLTEKRTTLRAKQSYLRKDAFELKVLRQEIAALEAQRAEEMHRFVTGSEDQSMAGIVKKYEALKIEHEFALGAYTTALTMVESAALEAAKQEKFLLPIAPPHLPEKPVFPRPLRGTAVVFILAVALLGIGRLVVATIRDHTV